MKTSVNEHGPEASAAADLRWKAVLHRDPTADGKFYYSVRTTGVYCRPSCGARQPRPEHVCFHATRKDAEEAGFRPCKRCKPDQPPKAEQQAAAVAKVCRLLEECEKMPKLHQLAQSVSISPSHLHRMFKGVTGVTPHAYAAALRAQRVREKLLKANTVTEAIYDAGFNSNGRFYASSDQVLGMTPTKFRSGGADQEITFALGQCSLGAMLVARSDRGICAISMGDDPDLLVKELQDRFPKAQFRGGEEEFEQTVAQVVALLEQPNKGLHLPLDLQGTAFQQRVWRALRAIPPGIQVTYASLAERVGLPKAVRAVASACAANTLAVAIPCHRVVRSDGALSGYRWGVERKRTLLEREARA